MVHKPSNFFKYSIKDLMYLMYDNIVREENYLP